MNGISSIWQGMSVYLFGPMKVSSEHLGLKTGSNRTRSPPGYLSLQMIAMLSVLV